MTWGKLVGATLIAWYGGLFCLAIYLGGDSTESLERRLSAAGIVVFVAIAIKGVAMTTALVGVRLQRRSNSRLSNTVLVILLIMLVPSVLSLIEDNDSLIWYENNYRQLSFMLYSTAFFGAWGMAHGTFSACRRWAHGP